MLAGWASGLGWPSDLAGWLAWWWAGGWQAIAWQAVLAGFTQSKVGWPGWVASTNAIRTYMLREWYTKVPNGPGAAQGGPKGGPV